MAAEQKIVHTACSLDCPDSCGVLVTVATAADGTERAVRVAGDPAHPVTRGFLCGKVAKFLDRVYAPDRLLHPMKRRAGVAKGPLPHGHELAAFERIGWEEAMSTIAERLQAISAEHGPESILPYSYAGTTGQLGYGSMDRRFFHRAGASQLDRTICAAAGGEALMRVYGVRLGTEPQNFAHAGLILCWGANVHGNNIHLWPFIEQARRKGARLVVIDPYRTRTAALADEWLQITPGTDTLLALALMHVIFREGLEDHAYLAECAHGAAELRAHALLPQHSPAAVAAATGIAAETIERLGLAYGRAGRTLEAAGPAVIRMNYGVQRSENGGTAARAIAMLPVLTGSWQQLGGGLQLSTSGAFPFNSAALQMPELMLQSPLGRRARTVNMSQLGHALTELHDPPVHAMFCYNSNPAAVAPNGTAVLRGLRRADLFTVVHDQFLTDTADYADILLPAPTFLETKDLQGAYGHLFVQVSSRAIAPLGEARGNVEVFAELGRRMFGDACFDEGTDILIDQALNTPGSRFEGITRQRLEQEGHLPLNMPGPLPFADASWFRTASGRAELLPVPVYTAVEEGRERRADKDAAYPLQFLPRKADNFMNTTFSNQPTHQRMEAATEGVLEMHRTDAAARGLGTGDAVEIFNARGSLVLRALLSGRVAEGVVAARLDWSKLGADLSGNRANVNVLTSERLTDIGGGATFYSVLVEVRRWAGPTVAAKPSSSGQQG